MEMFPRIFLILVHTVFLNLISATQFKRHHHSLIFLTSDNSPCCDFKGCHSLISRAYFGIFILIVVVCISYAYGAMEGIDVVDVLSLLRS